MRLHADEVAAFLIDPQAPFTKSKTSANGDGTRAVTIVETKSGQRFSVIIEALDRPPS